MVDLIKLLTKETNDILIDYWIEKASNTIINYLKCNLTVLEVQTMYKDAVIKLVCNYSLVNKDGGIVASKSQGARSVSYVTDTEANELDKSVKALLPKPLLRCY